MKVSVTITELSTKIIKASEDIHRGFINQICGINNNDAIILTTSEASTVTSEALTTTECGFNLNM